MFFDRQDAGRQLAAVLANRAFDNPVVVGLARGGVPVAAEIARVLEAPLDVLVVRKVGAPGMPEVAIGAVAAGVTLIDHPLARQLGAGNGYLHRAIGSAIRELEEREARYRRGRTPISLTGRVVILVDDGLATGASARTAVEAVRRQQPRSIVFAAPVCARESSARLRAEVAEVVCVATPPDFRAVSQYYEDFTATTDEEVVAALQYSREHQPAGS